jgi:diazepam-binding inhibitor (GABA receptor modulator, acyl-CoA-binding protein)
MSFEKAVEFVKQLPSGEVDDSIRLDFYKFYKQATEGDCSSYPPVTINPKEHMKHKAWKSINGMSREDAKKEYIALLSKHIPEWEKKILQ